MYTKENAIEDGKSDYKHAQITDELKIGDTVRISIYGIHCGKIGTIITIYPENLLDEKIIYKVKFTESNSGMFNRTQLIKVI